MSMNYCVLNQTYGSVNGNRIKNQFCNNSPYYNDFPMYDEDKYKSNDQGNDKAAMLTKGIMCEDELHPVLKLFFSDNNINRIQKMIRKEISVRTKGKYKLEEDQAESDLLISMRAVLFDANNGGKYLPFKITRQVKRLNNNVVQYVVPDMIQALKQYYGYLNEIDKPLEPMLRPMNVNNAGRRCLPSVTSIYEV